jgi:hypothetical protein
MQWRQPDFVPLVDAFGISFKEHHESFEQVEPSRRMDVDLHAGAHYGQREVVVCDELRTVRVSSSHEVHKPAQLVVVTTQRFDMSLSFGQLSKPY